MTYINATDIDTAIGRAGDLGLAPKWVRLATNRTNFGSVSQNGLKPNIKKESKISLDIA